MVAEPLKAYLTSKSSLKSYGSIINGLIMLTLNKWIGSSKKLHITSSSFSFSSNNSHSPTSGKITMSQLIFIISKEDTNKAMETMEEIMGKAIISKFLLANNNKTIKDSKTIKDKDRKLTKDKDSQIIKDNLSEEINKEAIKTFKINSMWEEISNKAFNPISIKIDSILILTKIEIIKETGEKNFMTKDLMLLSKFSHTPTLNTKSISSSLFLNQIQKKKLRWLLLQMCQSRKSLNIWNLASLKSKILLMLSLSNSLKKLLILTWLPKQKSWGNGRAQKFK